MDTWKRKLTHSDRNVAMSILAKLSKVPKFYLPHISYCSVPYYLKTDKSATLIYDSFAAIMPDEKIYVLWDCSFTEPEKELFEKIVLNVNYLGRSESFVELRFYLFSGNMEHYNMKYGVDKISVPCLI